MAEVTYVLKDPAGKVPTLVIGLFRYRDKRIKFSTNEKILPTLWDKVSKRARKTKEFPSYPEFNQILNNYQHDIKDAYRRFKNNLDREPTTEEFKKEINIILKKEDSSLHSFTLFSFIEKFIEESPNRINNKTGKPFSKSIVGIYKNTFRLLKEFEQKTKKKIDFDTIDLDFYHDFSEFLTKDQGFSNNTIGKHIKTLKTFLNDATERGINKYRTYKSKRFKVIHEDTDSIYLNEDEINEIYQLDLSKEQKLEKVRDLFIVGCLTGLRFSDYSNIDPRCIKGEYIEIEAKKTGQKVTVPIHPIVRQIMQKYEGIYSNSLPPTISNGKMNEYLKVICSRLPSLHKKEAVSFTKGGVNRTINKPKYELVVTHTARRSFASNQYLNGMQTITIMHVTGHKTEKAFMRYIKLTSKEHAKIMKLHWDKINSKLKVV